MKLSAIDVSHGTTHDGPGIRTTVFVKGCPLHCLWCQNPESWKSEKEMMYYASLCALCGSCVSACPSHALSIKNGQLSRDASLCTLCEKCLPGCPNKAREIVGLCKSVQEVYEKVASERLFLEESSGGLTISGGEALFYPEFTASLLALAKENHIHTAIETSCFASREIIDFVFPYVDLALIDIKHMNPVLHQQYIGVSNETILNNISYIHEHYQTPIIIRCPVIPGYNDSTDNMHQMGVFVQKTLGNNTEVHLLPYHNMGDSKRIALGTEITFTSTPPDSDHLAELCRILEEYELRVCIGG